MPWSHGFEAEQRLRDAASPIFPVTVGGAGQEDVVRGRGAETLDATMTFLLGLDPFLACPEGRARHRRA